MALFAWIAGEGSAPLFERPYGLAWQGGDLVVADPSARRLVRVAASGKVTQSKPDPAFAPLMIASCADGLVASDSESGSVARFDSELRRVSWLAQGLDRPTGVACSPGAVWVVETGAHRLVVLGRDGSRRVVGGRGTGDGQFNFPVALVRLGDAFVVGDTLNFRIQRLGATGRFRAWAAGTPRRRQLRGSPWTPRDTCGPRTPTSTRYRSTLRRASSS
jgi:hypothetical protein